MENNIKGFRGFDPKETHLAEEKAGSQNGGYSSPPTTPQEPEKTSGLLWKTASGIYSVGAGAIGLGVGTVKWAASTTCSVGSGVIGSASNVVRTQVSKATPKRKDKAD